MKAGLITFYQTNQTGALLSAAALEHAVETLGTDCEIINYHSGQPVQSQHVRQGREKNGAAMPGIFDGKRFALLRFMSDDGTISFDGLFRPFPRDG